VNLLPDLMQLTKQQLVSVIRRHESDQLFRVGMGTDTGIVASPIMTPAYAP
jgi:hypothetical protein